MGSRVLTFFTVQFLLATLSITHHTNSNDDARCFNQLAISDDGSCNENIVKNTVNSKILCNHIAKTGKERESLF
jgi:hypothetical protein